MLETLFMVWLVPTLSLAGASLFAGLICTLCAAIFDEDPKDDLFVRVFATGLVFCWAWPYGIVKTIIYAFQIVKENR